MSNYDQFGEHSRTQFSSRSGGREIWPWIKRTTVLLNNAGQIVAEVPEILDYEDIKARYADVSFVIYDLTISYKGQRVKGLNVKIPFAAMQNIKTGNDQDLDEPAGMSGLIAEVMQDPAKLMAAQKLMTGQEMTPEERIAAMELMKKAFQG